MCDLLLEPFKSHWWEFDHPVCMCSVDLEKTYDCVGVPASLLWAIRSLYNQNKSWTSSRWDSTRAALCHGGRLVWEPQGYISAFHRWCGSVGFCWPSAAQELVRSRMWSGREESQLFQIRGHGSLILKYPTAELWEISLTSSCHKYPHIHWALIEGIYPLEVPKVKEKMTGEQAFPSPASMLWKRLPPNFRVVSFSNKAEKQLFKCSCLSLMLTWLP